ncbi:translation initiation factor IF-2 N-terminal domain-containing protein [Acidimicrobiaceae bacterium]|nr:translation initiation factor IF-2 N-terminal domain-containing protein [Acidimicrobiaceae bacterium]
MAKKRIHQIAKELDVASADILFLSKELGIEVKTASSGLTPEEEELVVLAFNEKNSVTKSTNNDEVEISNTLDESIEVESETETLDDAELMPVEEVDIQIIEVSSGATPEELSPLVNIEATQNCW